MSGYGICPKCGVTHAPGSIRERSPDGLTQCGACGQQSLSRDWIAQESGAGDWADETLRLMSRLDHGYRAAYIRKHCIPRARVEAALADFNGDGNTWKLDKLLEVE